MENSRENDSLANEYTYFFDKVKEAQEHIDGFLGDQEQISLIADDIVSDLGSICPYTGEIVHISGNGLVPVVDDEGVLQDQVSYSEGINAMHLGTAILQLPDGEAPEVVHMLLIGEVNNMPIPTIRENTKYFAYFNTDSHITRIGELEESFSVNYYGDQDTRYVVDMLQDSTQNATKLLCSTKFRRLKINQQRRAMDKFIENAEATAQIRGLNLIADPSYAYTPRIDDNQLQLVVIELNDITQGECLGLGLLERLSPKAVRRDQDLIDKYAGICLVVDPSHEVRDNLGLDEAQVLYIPTNSQRFTIELL